MSNTLNDVADRIIDTNDQWCMQLLRIIVQFEANLSIMNVPTR